MDIYDRIDKELETRHMSRRQLAIAAGIPESTISTAFFRRTKKLSMENIQKIAAVLNIPWHVLMGLENMGGGVFGHEADPKSEISIKVRERLFGNQKAISAIRKKINQSLDELNLLGCEVASERIEELTFIPKYKKDHKTSD